MINGCILSSITSKRLVLFASCIILPQIEAVGVILPHDKIRTRLEFCHHTDHQIFFLVYTIVPLRIFDMNRTAAPTLNVTTLLCF